MEDVKWLLKRYGSFIVLMVVLVITGSIALGKRDTERNTEEVWEPLVVIENTEAVKENESVECFGEEFPNPAETPIGEMSEPVSILTAEEEQVCRMRLCRQRSSAWSFIRRLKLHILKRSIPGLRVFPINREKMW